MFGCIQLVGIIDYGIEAFWIFFDVPSLVVILVIPICTLIVADYINDFIKGVSGTFSVRQCSVTELQMSLNSVNLVIKTVMLSAMLTCIVKIVFLFKAIGSPEAAMGWLIIVLIPIYYAIIFLLLLNGIKGKMEREMLNLKGTKISV